MLKKRFYLCSGKYRKQEKNTEYTAEGTENQNGGSVSSDGCHVEVQMVVTAQSVNVTAETIQGFSGTLKS